MKSRKPNSFIIYWSFIAIIFVICSAFAIFADPEEETVPIEEPIKNESTVQNERELKSGDGWHEEWIDIDGERTITRIYDDYKSYLADGNERNIEYEKEADFDYIREIGFDESGSQELINTPDSTCFSEVGYDYDFECLWVRFRDSGASYVYYSFTESDWFEFIDSPSLGQYYNQYIKDNYEYNRVD